MNRYRNKVSRPGAWVCAGIFVVYALVFLGWQSELLELSQKTLSDGLTSYNPFVGTLLITSLLLLLAYLIYRFIATNLYFIPALYFMPSLLILASLADTEIVPGGGMKEGNALTWTIVLSALMLMASMLLRRVNFIAGVRNTLDLSKSILLNIVAMTGFCLLSVLLSNTDRDLHTDLSIETLIKEKDYEKLITLLENTQTQDGHTLMGRALAMAKTGCLGDRFFEQPVYGNSNDLLPSKDNRLLIIDGRPFYEEIGGVPGTKKAGKVVAVSARECMEILQRKGKLRNQDYLLIACMMDRDLKSFAGNIKRQYGDSIPTNLPRHYKEALTLYKHSMTETDIEYDNEEVEEDYKDFRKAMKDKKSTEVRDSYGNTYWYYYFFCTSSNARTQSVSREN